VGNKLGPKEKRLEKNDNPDLVSLITDSLKKGKRERKKDKVVRGTTAKSHPILVFKRKRGRYPCNASLGIDHTYTRVTVRGRKKNRKRRFYQELKGFNS